MDNRRRVQNELKAQRDELKRHPVFMGVRNTAGLKRLMEYHVFAQLDFAVMNHAVSKQVNWPFAHQSKELFEAYSEVMIEMGCRTRAIDTFKTLKKAGVGHANALVNSGAPEACVNYSTYISGLCADAKPHILLGILAYTRDTRVQETFIRALVDSPKPLVAELKPLDLFIPDYLAFPGEELKRDAIEMLSEICGDDDELWYQVREYSQKAMRLQRRVWDGLLNELVMV